VGLSIHLPPLPLWMFAASGAAFLLSPQLLIFPPLSNLGLVCVLPLIWGVLSAPMLGGTHIHIYFLIYNTVFLTLFSPG